MGPLNRAPVAQALGAVIVGAGVLALVGCGGDDEPARPAVEVSDAWARPTPAGATVGAVYLTLRSTTDDALVALRIDPNVGADAELHESVVTNEAGLTTMRELPALELPADEDVVIESGEHHIMLVDLADPLEAGATFDLSLDFEHAPTETVIVEVGDDGP